MNTYVILLRGINVGGKNNMPMAQLVLFLEEHGFTNVVTYIQSGNVILQTTLSREQIKEEIEELLPKKFKLDSSLIKVLVLSDKDLKAIIDDAPKGFGKDPTMYHSDVVFLIDITPEEALLVFDPRVGVDRIWPGNGVIYSQRLSVERTKSRLNKIIGTPAYKSMTIRNWNTTTKLLSMIEEITTRKGV